MRRLKRNRLVCCVSHVGLHTSSPAGTCSVRLSTYERHNTLPYEQTVLSILRDFGIVRAQLFGSAARGELTPASDIDLLVKPDGPVDYGQLFLLQEALEAATGRSFDILTSIKEPFRPYIEPELIELPL